MAWRHSVASLVPPRPYAAKAAAPPEAADATRLSSGVAYCWGSNFGGELVIGSRDPQDDRTEPTPVAGSHTFRMLGSGHDHFCGVTTSDETYCWGEHNGSDTALPAGSSISNAPVLVPGAPAFAALVGVTWCWGALNSGQLGNGQVGHVSPPFGAGVEHSPSPQRVVAPFD